MDYIENIVANSPTFLFVFMRTGSIILLAPVFGTSTVPLRLKLGLVVLLSVVLFSIVPPVSMPQDLIGLTLGLGAEVAIGAVIGLAARFVFASFEFAGQVVGFQMGLGMANVYDPINSVQITVLGKLMSIMSMLVFLSINGHIMVIAALKKSFAVIPPYGFQFSGTLMEQILYMSKDVFVIGAKIATPVMGTLLLVNIGLGIGAKAVPALNMFVIGFAIAIMVGFMVIGLSIEFYQSAMVNAFQGMWWKIFKMLEVM
ncbi:Flagellar biosynthesis protein FliR [hydrothermal vent metagenome]|uniref:Flagellar biosynthesis protein FliR n=1 Tax=hydrothermal vent metagenome TaxID=652676 RepID=A0A3B0QYU3_9ZZZZ